MKKVHCVYPPEIIQTSTLGRFQKKSLDIVTVLYVVYVLQLRVRKPPTDNIPSWQNYLQINCQSVITVLLKSIGTTLGQFV